MRILVEQLVLCIVIFFSFAGSVLDTDPDSIGSLNPDPYPGRKKCPYKNEKSLEISCCEVLDVLFGGLEASPVDSKSTSWIPTS